MFQKEQNGPPTNGYGPSSETCIEAWSGMGDIALALGLNCIHVYLLVHLDGFTRTDGDRVHPLVGAFPAGRDKDHENDIQR